MLLRVCTARGAELPAGLKRFMDPNDSQELGRNRIRRPKLVINGGVIMKSRKPTDASGRFQPLADL